MPREKAAAKPSPGHDNGRQRKPWVWFNLVDTPDHQLEEMVHTVTAAQYDGVLVAPQQARSLPEGIRKIGLFRNGTSVAEVVHAREYYDRIVLESDLFDTYTAEQPRGANPPGVFLVVDSLATLNSACAYLPLAPLVVLSFKDETKIPLERVVAEAQSQSTQVVVFVADEVDTEITLGTLEVGCDGVIYWTADTAKALRVGSLIARLRDQTRQPLGVFTVTAVKHVGMGDRACVDTCTTIDLDEGILIGSFSRGGILICSESHPLPYMPPRPFRVNAGSLHSYVWCPDNRTRYLADLKSGMDVLVVRRDGVARRAPVGRVKIERRPLLSIDAISEHGESISVTMQDDWHIRVFGVDGSPKHITTLKPGDQIIGCGMPSGRHVGIAVEEFCLEQ